MMNEIITPQNFLEAVRSGLYPDPLDMHFIFRGMEMVRNKAFRQILEQALSYLGHEDWTGYKEMRTLDIGCGGENSYPPWLPAILAALGAESYGIDIEPQTNYPGFDNTYKHVQFDFTELATGQKLSAILGSEEFQLVTCLYTFRGNDFFDQSPNLTESSRGTSLFELEGSVINAVKEILAPNGIFIFDQLRGSGKVYRKVNDEIVCIGEIILEDEQSLF